MKFSKSAQGKTREETDKNMAPKRVPKEKPASKRATQVGRAYLHLEKMLFDSTNGEISVKVAADLKTVISYVIELTDFFQAFLASSPPG